MYTIGFNEGSNKIELDEVISAQGLPGTAHQDAILGFDALRVFVLAEAFGELVRERVETGVLANALEALRTLYGDL